MNLAIAIPGPQEMIVIAGVLVILFGANRIPKLARSVGESIMELKKGLKEASDMDEVEEGDDEHKRIK